MAKNSMNQSKSKASNYSNATQGKNAVNSDTTSKNTTDCMNETKNSYAKSGSNASKDSTTSKY